MHNAVPFRRFAYLRDPLFLACVILYVVNRFWIKPNCDIYFFHAWLNDFICIPFTVPPMLWLLRCTRLRFHDGVPTFWEISIPLVIISWAFEIFLPNTALYRDVTVADPWDIVAYGGGAVCAGGLWRWRYAAGGQNTP